MNKIMQINITCGRGSTGKLAMALYEASLSAGFQATFAYSAYTSTLDTAFSIETKWQNYLRRCLNRFFGKKQIHSNIGTCRLIKYIKKEKPDIIHIHNVQQNCVNYNMFFSFLKESQIPIVYTLHDCWSFTGGCFHFLPHNCMKYKTECENCPLEENLDDITWNAENSYKTKKNLIGDNKKIKVYTVSQWLRDSAVESYMGKMLQLPRTIYNGVDTVLFRPCEGNLRKQLGLPMNKFLILGVADYWNEEKGIGQFLNLAENMTDDMRIILIGGDALKYQKENKIICFDKTKTQQELVMFYSAADVFVNASFFETFGMTTAEALACGTPAIVMNSTACPEIVDKSSGIVIDGKDGDLYCAVREIKNKTKSAYSNNCVKRACECFDSNRMTQEYIEIYRSILNEKQG